MYSKHNAVNSIDLVDRTNSGPAGLDSCMTVILVKSVYRRDWNAPAGISTPSLPPSVTHQDDDLRPVPGINVEHMPVSRLAEGEVRAR